jgi:hypothetical protein
MVEPFAQIRAWGDILEPNHVAQLLLADPARPDAIHQNALTVVPGWRLIDPFYPQIFHGNLSRDGESLGLGQLE